MNNVFHKESFKGRKEEGKNILAIVSSNGQLEIVHITIINAFGKNELFTCNANESANGRRGNT